MWIGFMSGIIFAFAGSTVFSIVLMKLVHFEPQGARD